jgi:uncharacterized protein YbjT (DUF2867 family)
MLCLLFTARALVGLLDVGFAPEQLRILTRRTSKAEELRALGFEAAVADLDTVVDDGSSSNDLVDAVAGCSGCYIHSTSSDTKALDTGEVDRAHNLIHALLKGNVRNVVFNSAAGEDGHGVERIRQKHDVERAFVLASRDDDVLLSFTSLRANLFMEELWKRYTRPSILKGTFPFSVPSDRPIYLTSVRDMGRLAGTVLLRESKPTTRAASSRHQHRVLNVAGDVLTPRDMADAFARAQGSPCKHSPSRVFALLARLFFRDLYEVIRFYRRSTETTDIDALQREFPGLLTSFEAFLAETRWSNPDRTFEDLQKMPDLLSESRSSAQALPK